MRDLTLHEIDDQLAEQLPSRELMGSSAAARAPRASPTTRANGNGNGNTTWQNGWSTSPPTATGTANNIVLL
jgi:hypothetical protein